MATITFTHAIPGVPLLDQLKEESNPTWNCLFECNAAMASAYLHKPYNGDQIKALDPHYGQNYTGGSDERDIVATMAKLGIRVAAVAEDTQQKLVDQIHWQIEHYGQAVIVTIPSEWNSAVTNAGKNWNPRTYTGPTHCVLMCASGPGVLRAMNPWHGVWHDGTDEYWSLRLLKGEVWVGSLIPQPAPTPKPAPAPAEDPKVKALEEQLAAATSQIAQLEAQLKTAQASAPSADDLALLKAVRGNAAFLALLAQMAGSIVKEA